MKMTLHTLEYLLSFSLPLCPINEEHKKHRLKGVKLWDEQARFWDVLYLIRPEGLRILRQSNPKQAQILSETCCFACPEPMSDGSILCPQKPVDSVDFFNRIQDCFFSHEMWMTEIRETLFQTCNPQRIFPFCGAFLHFNIGLFDDDYNVLASSVVPRMKRLPLEQITSLTQEEEFQHVKELSGVFEYASAFPDTVNLCYNIFVGGSYFARLVATCPANISLSGPSALVEELGELLTDFYEHRCPEVLKHTVNEEFRRVLTMLLTGTHIDRAVGNRVLEQRGGWKADHSYLVVCFEFQIPVSMDYYCAQMEQQFSGSSTVLLDQCIYCVINLSVSETAEQDFWSRIPVFLRECLCKAGIGSICDDFYRLYDCRLEADAALRLGKQRQESFWYYRFSDYIMDYIVEAATERLPAGDLCHPAVRKLKQKVCTCP